MLSISMDALPMAYWAAVNAEGTQRDGELVLREAIEHRIPSLCALSEKPILFNGGCSSSALSAKAFSMRRAVSISVPLGSAYEITPAIV